jgi:hypothetical protein
MVGDYLTYGSWGTYQLPKISGKWFYVDGRYGNAGYSGLIPTEPVLTLQQAYDKCTSGAGDGIIIVDRAISGTSYYTRLTKRIIWAKYGITVFGVSPGTVYNAGARVTSSATATADTLGALIYLTGRYNTFMNVSFINVVDCQTATAYQTAQHTAVQIGGDRNKFINCQFSAYDINDAGASTTTYAAYLSMLEMRASGDECVFKNCWFGNASYDVAGVAAAWIYLAGAAAQDSWEDCTFIQQSSTGTGFGAVKSGGATTINGILFFKRCTFGVWRANAHSNTVSSAWFIGTNPSTGIILVHNCMAFGFTHWSASNADNIVWTNNPAGAADGGIAVDGY